MANSAATITIAARDIVAFVVEQPSVAVDAPQPAKREPRRRKTGRNQQFNIKAKAETIEEFYAMADALGVDALGELLEMAVKALKAAQSVQVDGAKPW